jgi:uncharacterized protein (TIGR02118 family)
LRPHAVAPGAIGYRAPAGWNKLPAQAPARADEISNVKEETVIKVSVLYPNTAGCKFDMRYYLDKHMPMVQQKLGAACKRMAVEEGIAGGAPGASATYVAMGHLYFDSTDAFQAAFARTRRRSSPTSPTTPTPSPRFRSAKSSCSGNSSGARSPRAPPRSRPPPSRWIERALRLSCPGRVSAPLGDVGTEFEREREPGPRVRAAVRENDSALRDSRAGSTQVGFTRLARV